jgi:hypothetical protein
MNEKQKVEMGLSAKQLCYGIHPFHVELQINEMMKNQHIVHGEWSVFVFVYKHG